MRRAIVAFDTETTSLDSVRAELVGISLATAPGAACYIPVGHRAPGGQGNFDLGDGNGSAAAKDTPPQIPLKDAVALLKPLLEDPARPQDRPEHQVRHGRSWRGYGIAHRARSTTPC